MNETHEAGHEIRLELPAWILPSLPALIFALILAAAVFFADARTNVFMEGDTFADIRIGGDILTNGHAPGLDTLSYTRASAFYVSHHWLYQLISALAYRAFQLGGIVFLSALLAALTGALMIKRARSRGSSLPATILALAPAFTILWCWYRGRAHLISWLGFALAFAVFDGPRWKQHRWAPVMFFAFTALWSNLHPGVLIFAAFAGLEAAGAVYLFCRDRRSPALKARARNAVLVLGAVAAGTLATPYGIKLHLQVLGFLRDSAALVGLEEYLPFDLGFYDEGVAFAAIIACVLFWIGRSLYRQKETRFAVRDAFMIGAFTALTFVARRNIPFFAIVSFPAVAAGLDQAAQLVFAARSPRHPETPRQSVVSDCIWCGVLAMLVFGCARWVFVEWASPRAVRDELKYQPVEATDFILGHEAEFHGRMFNAHSLGGYLLYAVPATKVFVDPRVDFYGGEIITQLHTICGGGPRGLAALDRWNVDWLILDYHCTPIVGELARAGWKLKHQDSIAKIYVR
ncbi:MAG: hypothetical protein HY074_01795 [Deltaproteobacteria bacterium]|nr:hypothetical protein [Deltaproteobacteria bacterium]